MTGAAMIGIGLVVGLAFTAPIYAAWAERKMRETEEARLNRINHKTRLFYGAIGEKWYPHRNADGTISHFTT